jgi:hypothetical protein
MRFLMIVKATEGSEAGNMPGKEILDAMGRYNEEMRKAGVLIAIAGLRPSSQGARVHFYAGERTVTDGPFAETKELIGGYWLIRVKSKAEAIEWALRAPAPCGNDQDGQIELRQLFEIEDFAPGGGAECAFSVNGK